MTAAQQTAIARKKQEQYQQLQQFIEATRNGKP